MFVSASVYLGHSHVAMPAQGGSWRIWPRHESASLSLSSFSHPSINCLNYKTSYGHSQALPHAHLLCYCPGRWEMDVRYCSPLHILMTSKKKNPNVSWHLSADIISQYIEWAGIMFQRRYTWTSLWIHTAKGVLRKIEWARRGADVQNHQCV